MRLLCGLLLFSIIDCCFLVAGIWNLVFHSIVGVTQFSASTLALQLLFTFLEIIFLALFKLIPTKLTHFQLICQNFFSHKNFFHKQISSHWIQTKIFRIHSLASGLFQGRDGLLASHRFQRPYDNITELPVELFKKKKENLRKTAEITINIVNAEQKIRYK